MLVLARRPGQKVVFPGLGISVEILRSRGTVARLGIEAPDDVVILRSEVAEQQAALPAGATQTEPMDRRQRHEWRNRLNQVMLKLQLLQRRLELGAVEDPEAQLADMFAQMTELEKSTDDTVVQSTPPRVLVVEDQDNERELLATCLRLGGVEVITAANGREAFDRLHEDCLPDLVLLDMRMPDVDGPTFLKSVRDDVRLHNLRVFGVSGSSRNEFGPSPLPIDGWFCKPVRIDALLSAVCKEHASAIVST